MASAWHGGFRPRGCHTEELWSCAIKRLADTVSKTASLLDSLPERPIEMRLD